MQKKSKNRNESKDTNKEINRLQFQWKLIKKVFVLFIIVMITSIYANKYTVNEKSIYQKIGSSSLYSAQVKEAYIIKEYGVTPYINMINSGDYVSAYSMLSDEYKDALTYEEYLKTIDEINFKTFNTKNIKKKTEETYVAQVIYEKSGESIEDEYLIYMNENNPELIKISPNKFIYSFHDLEFEMDNVELSLQECNVYTDRVEIKATIKNTSWFETMKFVNFGVGYNDLTTRDEDIEVSVSPGEENDIEVVLDANYYIPNNIKLKRKLDDTTARNYTFYFERGKKGNN